jgi:hypothetical protein
MVRIILLLLPFTTSSRSTDQLNGEYGLTGLAKILALGISISMVYAPSATATEITCPADVYSKEYESYLKRIRELVDFSIEPQVYGDEEKIHELQRKFAGLPFYSDNGVTFVFADSNLKTLYKAECENCSIAAYENLAALCAAALGKRCVDFAVVVDGKPQCMLIPEPKL